MAMKWNMACNTIEVKLDDKSVCDCFVGRSSFAALHSCHEDHPPKPQWHHHLTQLSPATVRALDYLLWKYFCFPFTLKLWLFMISLFSHINHFFRSSKSLSKFGISWRILKSHSYEDSSWLWLLLLNTYYVLVVIRTYF